MASGTVLLFATIGEIFAERSGVMNLGVEGMMLIGAMSAFSVTVSTGNPWLGVLVAMLAGGLLSQIHAFLTVTLQSDQVVSGLALTFLGTGISLVLGEGLSKAGTIALLPVITIPVLSLIPLIGPILFTNQNILVYVGYLLVPIAWYYINRTRPGLHLRSVGEYPAAADALGINVLSPALLLRLRRRRAGRTGRCDDRRCLPGRARRSWPSPGVRLRGQSPSPRRGPNGAEGTLECVARPGVLMRQYAQDARKTHCVANGNPRSARP